MKENVSGCFFSEHSVVYRQGTPSRDSIVSVLGLGDHCLLSWSFSVFTATQSCNAAGMTQRIIMPAAFYIGNPAVGLHVLA